MDEFVVYNQLCVLEDIAGQYGEGREYCPAIRESKELVSTRCYRVAVIGEFKRGKSSLINALIGASILPTDVIPLTAAITRLIYGSEQEIIIHCKDGSSMKKTLSELIDYATKYDQEKEATAATVREIEVKYPSVLCKNHIEIIDTPGLNDNESMSQVTLSVLGEIDAAIVVISAKAPLSMTEQNLIVDLIRQEGIRHLVFVVTFLDALMEEEEKDRMIAFIRGRLGKNQLERARKEFADDPARREKAERILTEPDIFGVSSQQAMQGFTSDNESLLKESRFPAFKEELLALLTAAQSADIPKRLEQSLNAVEANLPRWLDAELQSVEAQRREATGRLNARQSYRDHSKVELTRLLVELDAAMNRYGMPRPAEENNEELAKQLQRCFARRLGAVTQDGATNEAIRDALTAGQEDAAKIMEEFSGALAIQLRNAMGKVEEKFQAIRRTAELDGALLDAELKSWHENNALPEFGWLADPLPSGQELRGANVMPAVRDAVRRSLAGYGRALGKYISSWRLILLRRNGEEIASDLLEQDRSQLKALDLRAEALNFNYRQHAQRLSEMRRAVDQANQG